MTTERGAQRSCGASSRSRSSSRSRCLRGAQRFTLSAEDAGVTADVGGMVDEALAGEPRRQHLQPRGPRPHRRRGGRPGLGPGDLLDRARSSELVRRVKRKLDRPARDAEVDFPSLEKVKEQKGRRVKAAVLQQRIAQALTVPGVDRTRQGAGPDPEAEGHPGRAGRQVPGRAGRRPLQLQAAALQEPAAREGVHGRGRARSASTPRPGSTTSRTRRSTPPGTCRTATGPATSPAPSSRAARPRTRSRRAGWASSTAPASTAPTRPTRSARAASHGCIRMAIPDVIELYDQVPVGAPIYIA